MPSIADLYSTIDSYKRRAADVLSDPQNSLMQMLGYANDRSREYNENLAQSLGVERAKLRGQQPTLADLNADKYIAEEMANSVIGGMTTWHGSPHTFNKFDMSKIGTGEGSQAYGHGLYVAQNPNVAKEYQKIVQGPESAAQQYLKEYKTRKEAISALEYGITPNLTPEAKKFSEDAINILKSGKELKGNLYKVDLPDEHIAKMLDWDKPLSQQPKNVQKAFNSIIKDSSLLDEDTLKGLKSNPDPTGKSFYTQLSMSDKIGHPSEASNILNKLDVPGIKYLDEQSRAAGEGTRNFVIFDPNLAKIEERNSVPIPQDPHAPNYLEDVHKALAQKPIESLDVHAPNYLEDVHNQLANKNITEPIESYISVHDKEIPVTMHPVEKRSGDIMTNINPETFDPAFEKTNDYVGENGEGGIGSRYKEFGDFVKKADSIRASNVYIKPNGIPVFGDGRHRYAYLRDQNVKSIPMAMDKESIENAKKYGYLSE